MIKRKPSHKGFGRSKPMNRVGKSNRRKLTYAWHKELLAEWQHKGINSCEFGYDGCMRTFGQALCHSMKRRFIQTKEDYWEVGLGCVKCHEKLDNEMGHEQMKSEVQRIISLRT